MSLHLKMFSATITVLLTLGALLIGGGSPLSPKEIADAASLAVDNSKVASANTAEAAESTRALADIARNVGIQLDLSKQLLDIQLGLEEHSKEGARRAEELERDIAAIAEELEDLERSALRLSEASGRAGRQVEVLAGSATSLDRALARLQRRFDEVVEQSRELNRKARGFEKLTDPVP